MPRPIPVGGKHKSRNFAIGLSGIDLTSADGFAYSLGRSVASAAASAGVGIAASDAGMGGFVSSISASLAGTAVNQATQSRPGLGLGSNSSVSYGRNGKEFKAICIEFDQAEFNRVIDGVKAKVFGRALDEEMSVPEAVEAAEKEIEQFVEEVETEQAKVKKTAEMISKNDERLKTEASQADSNKKKAYALVNGIGRINKKQAEVAVKTAKTPVQEAAQKTELELLAIAKQRYFENLQELEKQEKVQRADEAVRSRQTLIWSQLDDPNCVDLSNIKVEDEGAVRAAAERKVAKEFRHYRDVVDADFCAQCRFLKGEGYVENISKEIEQDPKAPTFVKEINSAKNRMERLRQEELSKVGESYVQRVAKMVPLLGSYVDYRYDPEASLGDFGKSLGIEAALLMMPVPGGGTVKAIGKTAKTAATVEKVAGNALKTAGSEIAGVAGKTAVVKAETTIASQAANDAFLKNVRSNVLEKGAGDAVNKAPYNPRNMESLLNSRYNGSTVTSSTMPKPNAKNVKMAGGGRAFVVGTDEVTGKPIVKHIPFNERGMPVFDDVAKVETRITGDLAHMKSEAHKVAATRQLKADIEAGKIDRKLFSDLEMKQIDAEKAKIGKWTWHHHEDRGRMQLVPEDIHGDIGHVGGNKLWGMEKK